MSLLFPLLYFLFFALPEVGAMGKRPPLPPNPEALSTPAKFPPLALNDCYELALKRSETVAIQKEDIKETEAQFFKAAGEALGDVDFIVTNTKQENPSGGEGSSVTNSFTDPERLESKFVIKQPLFQGFKALGALTGAGSLKKEQKEEWIRAKQLLFLDVARAFYGFLREKEDLGIIEGIDSLFEERIKDLVKRERIGRSRPSEVATAEARMKVLEAERARTRGTFAVAKHLLEFLTGIPLDGRGLREEELPKKPPQELARYLETAQGRADVEAARQSVKTAWRSVIVAQSALWPELSLEHNQYQRREGIQANIHWDLLFKVDVPLFRGGETVGKVKEAVSRWKKEKLAYSLVRRRAKLEIEESYQNWIASLEQTQALKEAVRASEENFRLQKEEYARNLVSNLDVLTALESLYQTRRDANRAYYQMKENYWALRISVGEIL